MPANVHRVAVSGFGEGTNDVYDRARPSYPAATLHLVRSLLPPPPRALTVLEPGSGTGIFSRLLLAPPTPEYPAFPNLQTLVGVEPSAGMRAAWSRGIARLPPEALRGADGTARRVEAVAGGFDDLSRAAVAPGSVDAVVIAQAWHWCPDYAAALREISHYLAPGAPLILVWNHETPTLPTASATAALYQPYDQGTPQFYRMLWRQMFDVPECAELFDPPQEGQNEWSASMTEDQLIDRIFSKSYLTEAHLSGEPRRQLEQQLRQAIQQADKEWIDKENGVFLHTYATHHVILRRKP